MGPCCRVGSLDGRADREAGGRSFADLLGNFIESMGERELQSKPLELELQL